MRTITLKDAKAGFSNLVDEAIKGEFVTITRHGKPVAALVCFAVSFGMGVVSGIVMPFRIGTNWSRFSDTTANVLAPLLARSMAGYSPDRRSISPPRSFC
jgi:prevent-host-death family protein